MEGKQEHGPNRPYFSFLLSCQERTVHPSTMQDYIVTQTVNHYPLHRHIRAAPENPE